MPFVCARAKKRQSLFGLSSQPYPKDYAPKPYSKLFVRHLDNNYAQAHPDEDWAETFALWLDPKNDWRVAYKAWGALKKLMLVEELMANITNLKPLVQFREEIDSIENCEQTLEGYFEAKRRRYRLKPARKISPQIKRLFAHKSDSTNQIPAHDFLSLHQKELCQKLAAHTKEPHYVIKRALKEASIISKSAGLYLRKKQKKEKQELILGLSLYVKGFVRQQKHRIAM